jgi:tetratricopeptide (TPR) repeat protein
MPEVFLPVLNATHFLALACPEDPGLSLNVKVLMGLQEQYDSAMFDFSQGNYAEAIAKLLALLQEDETHFDARLALGMAYYRQGDFKTAIVEGHKAEQLKPHEQLVHTNLSLFYMKDGDKKTAEHHGLQARIASWRSENQSPESPAASDPELELAKPKPAAVVLPGKFPDMPWKKKKN